MYIPGIKWILFIWIILMMFLLALLFRNIYIVLPLLSTLGFFIGIRYGRQIYYTSIPLQNILSLLDIDEIEKGDDYYLVRNGKKIYVTTFLAVKETEYIESELGIGDLAEYFMRFLHSGLDILIIIKNNYYILRLTAEYANIKNAEALKLFASQVKALKNQLLHKGYISSIVPVDRVERDLGIKLLEKPIGARKPSPFIPLLVLLLNLLGLFTPYILPFTIALTISVWKHHLSLLKYNKLWLKFKDKIFFNSRLLTEKYPSKSEIGSIALSLRDISLGDSIIFIHLKPYDILKIYRLEKRSEDILDKESIAKIRDVRSAAKTLMLVDRIRKGEMPFLVSVFVCGDKNIALTLQFLRNMGITMVRLRKDKMLDIYCRILGVQRKRFLEIYEDFEEKINSWSIQEFLRTSIQLAVFSPFSFIIPRTAGGIFLGVSATAKHDRVYLELNRLENVHGLLIGPPGSGKSTTARTIILRAEKKFIPIVIDPSGEYRRFFEAINGVIVDLVDYPFNPLSVDLNEFFKAMRYIAPLSFEERDIIRSIVENNSDIGVVELYRSLERRYSFLASKIAEILPYFSSKILDNTSNNINLDKVLDMNKPVLLTFGSTRTGKYIMMPIEVMRFTFHIFLAKIVKKSLEKGLTKIRYLLIVDEAHLFAKPSHEFGEPLTTTVARIYRKFGVALMLLTHSWSDVDEVYRNFCGYTLALGASQPDYLSYTRLYMGLDSSAINWLKRGEPGNAVLKRIYTPHPVLLKIIPEDIALTEWSG